MSEKQLERVVERLAWPPAEQAEPEVARLGRRVAELVDGMRTDLGELERLARRLPARERRRLPRDLAALRPGDSVELEEGGAVTHPLARLRLALEDGARRLAEALHELSGEPAYDLPGFEARLRRALSAADPGLLADLHRHLERLPRPTWDGLDLVGYRESAGLRETLRFQLTPSVRRALDVLAGFVHDRSVEAGDADLGERTYLEAELAALTRDLRYVADRLHGFTRAGEETSLTAPEATCVAAAAEVEEALAAVVGRLERAVGEGEATESTAAAPGESP